MRFNKSKTLSEVIDLFNEAKASERYSPMTLDEYQATFSKFKAFTGASIPFRNIGVDEVRSFLKSQVTVSDKTLCNYHTGLSSLWTWAVENGHSDEHVLRKIKRPTYVTPRIIPFTEDEVKKLIRACRCKRDKAIVMLLLDTGMRASELTSLGIEDWNRGTLVVRHGKGKKSRIVPISEQTEKALQRQLLKRKVGIQGITGGDAIFASNISGHPLNYNALSSLMERLEKYSGVREVHCHRFRHTFAINFLRNGGNIYALKRILGHSTLVMVQRYLDIAQSDITEAHQKASPVSNWQILG